MKSFTNVQGSAKPKPLVADFSCVWLHTAPTIDDEGNYVYDEVQLTMEEYAEFQENGSVEGLDSEFVSRYNEYVTTCLAEDYRIERDKRIAATDWTQLLDAPISDTSREEVRVYRQALRDVPQQEGFPHEITWPDIPAVVKGVSDPVDTAFNTLLGGNT